MVMHLAKHWGSITMGKKGEWMLGQPVTSEHFQRPEDAYQKLAADLLSNEKEKLGKMRAERRGEQGWLRVFSSGGRQLIHGK